MKCPNCGKEVSDEDAVFCPYCAKPLHYLPPSPTLKIYKPMRITGSILAIISASLAIAIGIIYIVASAFEVIDDYGNWGLFIFYLIAGIFCILGFAFGLSGAVSSLRRKRLSIALFGSSWLIIAGIISSIYLWFFGVPITILAILSVVFIAVSRVEFS